MDIEDKKLPETAQLPWGEVAVDESLSEIRFARGSTTGNCRGTCCRRSVLADTGEKARIFAHAAAIISNLDADQVHDRERWFDRRAIHDPDFPSGEAFSTGQGTYGCVFLNRRGRCTLQITEQRNGIPNLKPFYCRLYPLTVEKGCLLFDARPELKTAGCCVPETDGPRDIFDVCRAEIGLICSASSSPSESVSVPKRARD